MKISTIVLTGLAIYAAVSYYRRYENDIIGDIDKSWEKFKKYRMYESPDSKIIWNGKHYDTIKEIFTDNNITIDDVKDIMNKYNVDLSEALSIALSIKSNENIVEHA